MVQFTWAAILPHYSLMERKMMTTAQQFHRMSLLTVTTMLYTTARNTSSGTIPNTRDRTYSSTVLRSILTPFLNVEYYCCTRDSLEESVRGALCVIFRRFQYCSAVACTSSPYHARPTRANSNYPEKVFGTHKQCHGQL